jgi:hypothetical protein
MACFLKIARLNDGGIRRSMGQCRQGTALVLVFPDVLEHRRQRLPGRWIIGGKTHLLAESRDARCARNSGRSGHPFCHGSIVHMSNLGPAGQRDVTRFAVFVDVDEDNEMG